MSTLCHYWFIAHCLKADGADKSMVSVVVADSVDVAVGLVVAVAILAWSAIVDIIVI